MVLAGWAVLLSNALAFLLLPAFVVYINRFQIAPEERALTALFVPGSSVGCHRVRRCQRSH